MVIVKMKKYTLEISDSITCTEGVLAHGLSWTLVGKLPGKRKEVVLQEVVPLAPRFASQSAMSFPMTPAWPGTQTNENDVTRCN